MEKNIWYISLEGVLLEGHFLAFLVLLLEQHPAYCPLEVLLASISGSTSEKNVQKARETLYAAAEQGTWESHLRPMRNLLSRVRNKLRALGIEVLSIQEVGYMLQASRTRSTTQEHGEGIPMRSSKKQEASAAMSTDFDSHVRAREQRTPWATIPVERLLTSLTLFGEASTYLSVVPRHEVSSHLWWTLEWTAANGKRQRVEASRCDKLLWRAAGVEIACREALTKEPETGGGSEEHAVSGAACD